MPHPHNAVVKLSRAIAALGGARLPQHNTAVVEAFLRAVAERAPLPERLAMPRLVDPRFAGFLLSVLGKTKPAEARGLGAMLRNTVSPTMLAAGKKVNVIPASASAQLDGRVIPGQSVEAFLAEVRAIVGEDVTLNVFEQHDGTVFPSDTPLFATIRDVLAERDPGATTVPYMIPGFTDAFAYKKLGAICYGFAPTRLGPDLDFTRMYHGHDERIPTDGFTWGLQVLFEVVRAFCGAG
jgi:acetylornithine deacetylase/succinyl-diaminopimelate desuccinylase-like protein